MTAMLVIAIVIGVRTVGAILMVAMLIVPTVTARQLTSRLSTLLVVAGIAGAVVGSAGSLISTGAGIPTGPVIVLVGFVVAMSAILLAPGRGVVWKAHRVTSERRRALNEGVLIDLETALQSGPPPTVGQLASLSGRPPAGLRRALRNLDRAGVLRRDGDRIALSATGTAAVQTLFDRRELWSAWLENGWRIELPDAGEPDPRDLRASLGDDLTDQLLAFSRGGPGE
jgi:manganese/zinc/iron transport system permease protein